MVSQYFQYPKHFAFDSRDFSRIAVFLILAGCLNTCPADETECPAGRIILTTQFSVLEDPGRSLTIEQVNEPHYAGKFRLNVDGRTNFGMSRSAFWIRIEPMMPPDCKQDWLLAFGWPNFDTIEFFWHENRRWTQITTGAKHPYTSRQIDHHHFVFRLPDLSDNHPPYFVRVVGDNPMAMIMSLWLPDRFAGYATQRLLIQGMYLGIFTGLILYNLFVFLALRDTAYLYYVIYLVSVTLLVAAYTGIATRYLWPTLPDWNVRTMWTFSLSGTCAYLAFIRKFLDTPQIAPKLDQLIRWSFIVLLLAMAALHSPDYANMVRFSLILSVVGFILSGFAIIISIKNGYRPARFVGLANIMFASGMIWGIAMMFGFPSEMSDWSRYVFELGVAVEAILLSLALASSESPRVCRRLHFLRGWSDEQIKKIFPGNPGTCSTHGV